MKTIDNMIKTILLLGIFLSVYFILFSNLECIQIVGLIVFILICSLSLYIIKKI